MLAPCTAERSHQRVSRAVAGPPLLLSARARYLRDLAQNAGMDATIGSHNRDEPHCFVGSNAHLRSLGDTRMRLAKAVFAILAGLALATLPSSTPRAQIVVSIRVAPPALPIYVQPPIPGPRYIWIPGYWAWDVDDYYWVPGTWVLAPGVGLLWTPGYWGWREGIYVWNAGYWGPRIGFYGGINYGYGYTGVGFEGGYWRGGVFMYNRAVTNVGSVHITNVYNKTVINNTTVTNVSFNGGTHGTSAQPTPQERAAALDKHIAATEAQTKHQQAASSNRALHASVNKGNPAIAATARPGHFTGAGVIAAKGAQPLPKTLNTVKSSTGQPGPKPVASTKLSGPTGTKGGNATNTPSGVGPVNTKRINASNTPSGVGPATAKRVNSASSGPPGNRQPRPVTARGLGPPGAPPGAPKAAPKAAPKQAAGQVRRPPPGQHANKPNPQ
jgi:hypothetical protein